MAQLLIIDVHVTRGAVQAAAALAFNTHDPVSNCGEHHARAGADLDHVLRAIWLDELDVSQRYALAFIQLSNISSSIERRKMKSDSDLVAEIPKCRIC